MDETDLSPLRSTLLALTTISGTLQPLLDLSSKHHQYLYDKRVGNLNLKKTGNSEIQEEYTIQEIQAVLTTLTLALPTLFYINLRLKGVKVSGEHAVRKMMDVAGGRIRDARGELERIVGKTEIEKKVEEGERDAGVEIESNEGKEGKEGKVKKSKKKRISEDGKEERKKKKGKS